MKLKMWQKNKKTIIVTSITVLIGILALLLVRNILIFGIFLFVNALLNYYQGRTEFPFDLTPSLVLMILFSIKLGFGYGLVFLFLGSVIPSVVAGGFDHTTFLYIVLAIGISYFASLGLVGNIILYGLGLIVAQSIFSFFISLLSDDPSKMFSVFLGLGLNVLYFFALNKVLLGIFI